MAMAFAADRWGVYATRFMIGAAEAGFFPGVLFYLTLWFPSSCALGSLSLFAIGVPLSGVVAAPASSWIMTHMAGLADLKGWRWLFLIEGAPAVALGLVAYFVLPDRPASAHFLCGKSEDRARSRSGQRSRHGLQHLRRRCAARGPTFSRSSTTLAFYAMKRPAVVGSDPSARTPAFAISAQIGCHTSAGSSSPGPSEWPR